MKTAILLWFCLLFFVLGAAAGVAQAPSILGPAPPPPVPHKPLSAAKKIAMAAVAGTAAGVLIGVKGLSFSALPTDERSAHEFRAGLTYGAIGGVLSGAVATRLWAAPTLPGSPSFWWNRWNTPLLAGIVAVQALDFTSTQDFREHGKNEWLLTNSLVDDKPAFAATEASAAAAGIGLAYILHRTGHNRLERWFAAGYVSWGVASAVGNYRYATTGHDIF